MKLGAAYNVFDGEELLENSIVSIRSEVDYVVVVYQTCTFVDSVNEVCGLCGAAASPRQRLQSSGHWSGVLCVRDTVRQRRCGCAHGALYGKHVLTLLRLVLRS
jgi:hypothetical protein